MSYLRIATLSATVTIIPSASNVPEQEKQVASFQRHHDSATTPSEADDTRVTNTMGMRIDFRDEKYARPAEGCHDLKSFLYSVLRQYLHEGTERRDEPMLLQTMAFEQILNDTLLKHDSNSKSICY